MGFFTLSDNLAIDLGTVNTCVFAEGSGLTVSEPSILAVNRQQRRVQAVGREARDLVGRLPEEYQAVRPMRDGVIADTEAVQQMLAFVIRKAQAQSAWRRRRMVIGVPSEITPVEQRAVRDTALKIDAKEIRFVPEPVAAAIGAGIDILDSPGNMVVDIGGGTTNIAVISRGYLVFSHSMRVAGNRMDEAIAQYVRRRHQLVIGERTAERVKIAIGSAMPLDTPECLEVRGQDLRSGAPSTSTLQDGEVREALGDVVRAIVLTITESLSQLPPEVCSDIYERGLIMTGGGSLLRNLASRVRHATELPVQVAEDPLRAVVSGAARMLADDQLLNSFSTQAA